MATQQKLIFTGKMDMDSTPQLMAEGDYRYLSSGYIVSTDGGKASSVQLVQGNAYISYTLPGVDNKVIGTVEDKAGRTGVYFIYNSDGDHSIVRYYPQDGPMGSARKLVQDSVLNFDSDYLVTGANVVDKNLVWSDNRNYQRTLNMEHAQAYGKREKYHAYFQDISPTLVSREIVVSIFKDGNFVVNPVLFFTATGADLDNKATLSKAFAQAWNANGQLSAYLTAEACGSYVELTATQIGVFAIPGTTQDIFTSGPVFVGTVHFQAWNKYVQYTNDVLDLCPAPPEKLPVVAFKRDDQYINNYVEGKVFKFRIRYRYRDKRNSRYGGLSAPALDSNECGVLSTKKNYIEVDFTDPRLSNPVDLCVIEAVEIAYLDAGAGSRS